MRWDALPDPEMVRRAELEGFDVLLTADKELFLRQQQRPDRRISILLVNGIPLRVLASGLERILAGIVRASPGSTETILLALPPKTRKQKPFV